LIHSFFATLQSFHKKSPVFTENNTGPSKISIDYQPSATDASDAQNLNSFVQKRTWLSIQFWSFLADVTKSLLYLGF
jgi:hypothetical protein